ncbi:hypothetical protein HanPSC8_Chr04g0138411 [Helianthus annuus]|nr:hypothetical protein HanPSC8_Chr04g0138411 [Helianthus annuus]
MSTNFYHLWNFSPLEGKGSLSTNLLNIVLPPACVLAFSCEKISNSRVVTTISMFGRSSGLSCKQFSASLINCSKHFRCISLLISESTI